MLDKLRYRIGAKLMKRAEELIVNDEFEDTIKGLKLVKLAVQISPPSRELTEFGQKLFALVKRYS